MLACDVTDVLHVVRFDVTTGGAHCDAGATTRDAHRDAGVDVADAVTSHITVGMRSCDVDDVTADFDDVDLGALAAAALGDDARLLFTPCSECFRFICFHNVLRARYTTPHTSHTNPGSCAPSCL